MAERCPKCQQGTTPKSITDKAMCASCFRVWGRLSLQETLDQIPESVEAQVQEQILTKPTLQLAASGMKKLHVLKFPQREWDIIMVLLVDERRIRRAGTQVNQGRTVRAKDNERPRRPKNARR